MYNLSNLETLTVKKLTTICIADKKKYRGYSRLRKSQLIEHIISCNERDNTYIYNDGNETIILDFNQLYSVQLDMFSAGLDSEFMKSEYEDMMESKAQVANGSFHALQGIAMYGSTVQEFINEMNKDFWMFRQSEEMPVLITDVDK